MSKSDGEMHPTKKLNVFGHVAGFCALHAGKTLLGWLAAAMVSVVLAFTSLSIDTDPGKMISSDLPFRQSFLNFTHSFPAIDNNLLVVVEAAKGDEAREAARALVESFKARKDLFVDVYAPGLGAFFDKYGVLYLPESEVDSIVKKIHQSRQLLKVLSANTNFEGLADVLEKIAPAVDAGQSPDSLAGFFREISASVMARVNKRSHPLDWSAIVTGGIGREPDKWYISVKPVLDFSKIDPVEEPLAEAKRIIADPEVTRSGKVRVLLTGEAALNGEEFQSVTQGAAIAGGISFALVTLVIWLGLPVTRLIVPALGLLVLGFVVNVGFATLAVGSLNMISVAFAVLFIGLGIDYAVHSVLRYWEERLNGRDALIAVAVGAHHAGPALALCTVTTALAFLAFVPTDFVGMAQLGIIAAGGIVIAFVASFTLIPALLMKVPVTVKPKHLHNDPFLPTPAWQHIKLGSTVFVIMVAIAAIILIADVRFDGDPINLKDPKAPSVIAFHQVLKDQPGEAYAAQVIVADAEKAEQMAAKLLQLPTVSQVRWVDSFLPARQQEKLDRLATLRDILPGHPGKIQPLTAKKRRAALERIKVALIRIETSSKISDQLHNQSAKLRRALVLLDEPKPADAQTLMALERDIFLQLPGLLQQLASLAVTQPLDVHTFDVDVAKRYVTGDGRWRLEVIPAKDITNEAALRRFVSQVREISPTVTGTPVEITGAADVVSQAMKTAVIIAFGLVLLVLLPVLRSPVAILLVLTPLALSALLLLAYTVIFKSPFNFANVIVLPLLLGLGVDSAIHYVMRAREDGAAHDVVDTTTPRAVFISALTTVGSFGTLWLSAHKGTSSMGELLTIAIIITLVNTLIVLPQLIAWTIGRKTAKEPIDG